MQPLMKTEEVADVLRMSKLTLDLWRQRGKGPRFIKVGGAVRYRRQDVEKYLETLAEV